MTAQELTWARNRAKVARMLARDYACFTTMTDAQIRAMINARAYRLGIDVGVTYTCDTQRTKGRTR